MVIDYNQSWVPIVQTHDYTVVNLFGVMAHEIGNIISLSHSRDRFSLKHSNYRNWLTLQWNRSITSSIVTCGWKILGESKVTLRVVRSLYKD